MPIPYLLTTLLFTLVALFIAADASLVSVDLIGAFPALRWVRVHVITLGILSQVIFGLLPLLIASLSKKPKTMLSSENKLPCTCARRASKCAPVLYDSIHASLPGAKSRR